MKRKSALQKYALDAFERLDIAGADAAAAKALVRQFEQEVVRRTFGKSPEDFAELIAELNAVGHHFAPLKSSPGWTSYSQQTNGGARAFLIHVEFSEMPCAMVLYHETLETTVAKRRATMSPRQRKQADIEDEFAKRGLALNIGERAYRSLPKDDQLIACLHELEGGVSNGGFSTYLANTEGARIGDAAKFLEQIGAKKTAAIVRDVLLLFPGGFGPAFRKNALVLIDAKEQALDALTTKFYASRDNIAVLTMRHLGGTRKRKS